MFYLNSIWPNLKQKKYLLHRYFFDHVICAKLKTFNLDISKSDMKFIKVQVSAPTESAEDSPYVIKYGSDNTTIWISVQNKHKKFKWKLLNRHDFNAFKLFKLINPDKDENVMKRIGVIKRFLNKRKEMNLIVNHDFILRKFDFMLNMDNEDLILDMKELMQYAEEDYFTYHYLTVAEPYIQKNKVEYCFVAHGGGLYNAMDIATEMNYFTIHGFVKKSDDLPFDLIDEIAKIIEDQGLRLHVTCNEYENYHYIPFTIFLGEILSE